MNDQGYGDKPTTATNSDTPPPPPAQGSHPKEEITEDSQHSTEGDKKATNILARELHWIEGFQLAFSAILAIVGIIALIVYSRQLDAMRGQSATMEQTLQTMFIQTRAMQRSIAQADLLIASGRVSADAAKKSADTAYKSLEMSERPWIVADVDIAGPIKIENGNISGAVSVMLRNVGHSVARAVIGRTKVVLEAEPERRPIEIQKDLCASASRLAGQTGSYEMLMFPSDKPIPEIPEIPIEPFVIGRDIIAKQKSPLRLV